jgi:hypothetical protein
MINKIIKDIFIVLGSVILVFLAYFIYTFVTISNDLEKLYSKQDLIKNYNQKEQEINELKAYFIQILPQNASVEVNFESNNEPSILSYTNWSKQQLSELKAKLEKANCMSILNQKDYLVIGFKQSGMGAYYYRIFNSSLTDANRKEFNDGCTYSIYKENIVLEYRGGAIGSQCFDDFIPKK